MARITMETDLAGQFGYHVQGSTRVIVKGWGKECQFVDKDDQKDRDLQTYSNVVVFSGKVKNVSI